MKSCILVLDIATSALRNVVRDGAPRVFEALREIYVPCRINARLDHLGHDELRTGNGLWIGEEITASHLTQFSPGGDDLVGRLRSALTNAASQLQLSSSGALLHRAPGTASPAWYGRWRQGEALDEAWTVGFTWDEDAKEVEITFPLGGYPLTASRLGSDRIEDGDAAVALENRARVFGVLAKLPAVLELSAKPWSVEGDFQRWYPEDATDIHERWIPELRR